jgi:hypothetical protein
VKKPNTSEIEASRRRIAQRVLVGLELLPVLKRIELLRDIASILPEDEALAARNAAWTLSEAMDQQRTFLELLK